MSDKNRNFLLETPLGVDTLLVQSFSGTEEISRLYSYVVEMKSDNTAIAFDDIVGKHVTLVISLPGDKKRYISGHVKRFTQPSRLTDLNHYHMEIVPWLWFLTQRSDCRIFQGKTALDIVKAVFDGAGFSGKYEVLANATYRTREYCVQYRETDFHFVSRLMEEEGIHYFFKHDKGTHKLALCDAPAAHKPIQPAGNVVFHRGSEKDVREEAVMDFISEQSVRSSKISLRDFDFTKPSSDLTVTQKASEKYELYDFPGNYTERPDGDHYAKVRLEREQVGRKVFFGTATERRLSAGFTFKLIEHPRDEYNASYFLTSVHLSGNQSDEEATINCSFECIPANTPFQPQCFTAKPTISGCQTAIVVGPSGEELWLDKYGRIKVQFHWDRLGKNDEKSSCWIRVARDWAGKNWGVVFHPRIGQEVIVHFIEGDIDRPIVTDSVYNEEQMPPYDLPSNATQSAIKSRSSKSGQPDNFNEIRFEDKKGSEHFLIHAEKDHMVEVEHDETHTVGNNRNTTIEKDDTLTVKNNETISITGNRTETVEKDESVSITGNRSLTVDKNSTIDVTKNETKTVGENLDETVTKNATLKVNENRSHEIAKKDTLQVGKEWLVDAGDKVLIKCGDASISLKKDGTIEIKGKDIKVTGSGKINVKASSDLVLKGSKIAEN
jgi:type VI secretion system secreted protein VgrG